MWWLQLLLLPVVRLKLTSSLFTAMQGWLLKRTAAVKKGTLRWTKATGVLL